jgi:hypothetical protein
LKSENGSPLEGRDLPCRNLKIVSWETQKDETGVLNVCPFVRSNWSCFRKSNLHYKLRRFSPQFKCSNQNWQNRCPQLDVFWFLHFQADKKKSRDKWFLKFYFFFFLAVMGFKLRAYTLSYSTSPFLWWVFSR